MVLLDLPDELVRAVANCICHSPHRRAALLHGNALVATSRRLQEVTIESQRAALAAWACDSFPCLGGLQLTRVEGARMWRAINRLHHASVADTVASSEYLGWSREPQADVDPASVSMLVRVSGKSGGVSASALLPWQPRTLDYVGIVAATGEPSHHSSKAHILEAAELVHEAAERLSFCTPEPLFPENASLTAGCDFDRGEAMEYMHAAEAVIQAALGGDESDVDGSNANGFESLAGLKVDMFVISWQTSPGSIHRVLHWAPLVLGFDELEATELNCCRSDHFHHGPQEPQFSLSDDRVLSWHLRGVCNIREQDLHGVWTSDDFTERTFSGISQDGINYDEHPYVSDLLVFHWCFKTRLQEQGEQVHVPDGVHLEFVFQTDECGIHPLNLLLNRLSWDFHIPHNSGLPHPRWWKLMDV